MKATLPVVLVLAAATACCDDRRWAEGQATSLEEPRQSGVDVARESFSRRLIDPTAVSTNPQFHRR